MVRELLHVRSEDRRDTAAAVATLFGLMVAHAMLETARDALFLASLPASHLPWAYLAIAGLAVLMARTNRHCAGLCAPRMLLSSSLVIAGLVTAGMWLLARTQTTASLYVFYVWTGLVATVVVVQFWLLMSDAFTVSQAKRVYALIGAGGLLGATVGSAAAGALVRVMDPSGLILAAAAVFVATAVVARFVRRDDNQDAPPRHVREDEPPTRGGLAFLRAHPYLRQLALLVLVSTVTVTMADYLFKSVVAAEIEPDRLGSFFAQFYAALNGIALLVQLFLATWLLRTAGVNRTLAVMPALLLLATIGFIAIPGLILALLIKGTDGTLRHSVNRTSTELLFVPLPAELRHRFKAFIDALGQRGGQALASVAILIAIAAGASAAHIAIAIAVLALLWIATIASIKGHYLELFRQQLRGGSIDLRAELPALDLHQLETLMAALNSEEDATVVGALDMLAFHGKTNLIPALVLYHPSREVVLRALELFAAARRRDFSPIALRLMDGDDNEIRAAAVRAKSAVDPDEQRLRELLQDDSARVRATALVALITNSIMAPDEVESALREITDRGSPGARRALAQAIRFQPDDRLDWVLLELAKSNDRPLLAEVARAIAAQPSMKFLNRLLGMLATRDVRPAARDAIVAIGPRALDFLDGALSDESIPLATRRHIPRTISKFRSPKAARILVDRLATETDGMTRFKILRGLGRMRTDDPRLPLDHDVLRDVARRTLERAFTVLAWRVQLERDITAEPSRKTRGAELLLSLFDEKIDNATERLFRLLHLLQPKEDWRLIHAGLDSADARTRASSRELLAHLVEPELREPMLALVDDAPARERVARARAYFSLPRQDSTAMLGDMLSDGSEAVRCIAAYHVGELGIDELAEPLAEVRRERSGYLREVVDHALSLLGFPGEAPRHAN